VGTANYVNPDATMEILDGLAAFCARHSIKHIKELRGTLIQGTRGGRQGKESDL